MSLKIYIAVILLSLVAMSSYYNDNSQSFMGLAESKEAFVSLPNSAQILTIRVNSGQKVNMGDTLAILARPELIQEISILKRQLEELDGKTGLTSSDIKSQVLKIKAELQSKESELNLRIQQLENQLRQNLSISQQILKNHKTTIGSSNGIPLEIKNLKSVLSAEKQAAYKHISLLEGSSGKLIGTGDQIRVSLQKELERLEKEEHQFAILSPNEGIINDLFAGPNQNLAAYSPILSINALTPTTIKAYIPEHINLNLKPQNEVYLFSFSRPNSRIKGQVIGLGSRIVEIPISLRKYPDLITYGREVLIKIESKNPLLLNEKVRIVPRS